MAPPLLVTFAGGDAGPWRVLTARALAGEGLPPAARVAVHEGRPPVPGGAWALRGVTSNERYVTGEERRALAARQQPLGRPQARRAALIPITKSPAWWELPQDERRVILEERSRHVATGLRYLPAVARRLHHGRDLGEPFDFLTWFEFAPEHEAAFDGLLARLRATEEWKYVEREVDVRLERV
jgi:chlorite dismutase